MMMGLLQSGRRLDYIGESVSQLEHALQAKGYDDHLVVAALVHDIGHMAFPGDQWRAAAHDTRGAMYLREMGFPERVCWLVSSHMCTTDPSYREQLSLTSKTTMQLQGGFMTTKECEVFESHPWHMDAIRLRRCDDKPVISRKTHTCYSPTST